MSDEKNSKSKALSRVHPVLIVALFVAIAGLILSKILAPTKPSPDGIVARQTISPRKATDVIAAENQLRFFHEGSIYTLRNDHSFKMEPASLGGPMIQGNWMEKNPGVFEIDGKWTWMNGLSPDNDFRVMTLTIFSVNGKAIIEWRKEEVYTCDIQIGPAQEKVGN